MWRTDPLVPQAPPSGNAWAIQHSPPPYMARVFLYRVLLHLLRARYVPQMDGLVDFDEEHVHISFRSI